MLTPEIVLKPEECEIARVIAVKRQRENKRAGIKDNLATFRDPLVNVSNSFAAELAACKYFNVYPDLCWFVGNAANTDLHIGSVRVDVKWIPPYGKNMHARKNGRVTDIYLAVRGKMPTFRIVGWITYADAHQDKFYMPRRHIKGRRMDPHYKIPLKELYSMDEKVVFGGQR